ncbi:hypothetical protein BN1723_000105 [Verticillium longisporum]|uniref:Uncharacterized protein n=1 Tax=Verticillium longisporum TaxID=100787 RepID=A0A0G4KE07_VERLO|nr:hypothetical protein BN1723_000105 [Verticillium longisporum]
MSAQSTSSSAVPPTTSTRRRACVLKALDDCHYPSLEATVAAANFNLFADMLNSAATPVSIEQPIPNTLSSATSTVESDSPWPPLFYSPSSSPSNGAVNRDAVLYCTEQFRSYPKRWVKQNGFAPFVHPSFYLPSSTGCPESILPLTLQDAFCACAAYAAKNDENSDLILSIVESKATALLYADQTAWSLPEQLGALQALIMYQMIRWFDGDIRQRVLADAVEPVVATWTSALQTRVGGAVFHTSQDESGGSLPPSPPSFAQQQQSYQTPHQQQQPPPPPPPIFPCSTPYYAPFSIPSGPTEITPVRTPPGSTASATSRALSKEELRLAWRRWLLAESIRRTVIASHIVREVYANARPSDIISWTGGGSDSQSGLDSPGSGSAVLSDMSFTASARLWGASTPEQWRRAVVEASGQGQDASTFGNAPQNWWWVERMDFSGVFGVVGLSSVDEFAVLVAVVVRGREAVEDWITQGGGGI